MNSDGQADQPLGVAFSHLLSATFVTSIGDGVRLAALPLLAASLTSSQFLIGAVTAAQFLPWTTFAPFGGVIVDRANRRRLIMFTQGWRAIVMVVLAVGVATGTVQIWHLMVVAYLITAGEILVDPSVVATVPTLVKPRDLDRANGRITTVETVTNDFAGGPIGAFAFAFMPWLPFVIDAVSYAGSIWPFGRLPPNEPKTGRPGRMSTEMGEGVRWIVDHPFLRPLTIGIATFHLGTAGAMSMLVVLVKQELEAPDYLFGVVLAAAALGAVVASIVAAPLTARFSRRTVVTVAATLASVSVLVASTVTTALQLVAVWVINGAAGGVLLAIGRGFIQRHTPNERIGRTAVASRTITRTSFVIGALIAGTVASLASVRWSLALAGAFHLAGAVLLWWSFRTEPVDQIAP